jgi:hypothetical protein
MNSIQPVHPQTIIRARSGIPRWAQVDTEPVTFAYPGKQACCLRDCAEGLFIRCPIRTSHHAIFAFPQLAIAKKLTNATTKSKYLFLSKRYLARKRVVLDLDKLKVTWEISVSGAVGANTRVGASRSAVVLLGVSPDAFRHTRSGRAYQGIYQLPIGEKAGVVI